MAKLGIEPQTSRVLGNHVMDSAIADETTMFAISWCDLQNIRYIIDVNSCKR
jgi:hypothetical protein